MFHNVLTLKWLYLDINSYFSTIEQQLNPALRYKPIVIVPVEADTTCAIAVSHEAKMCGIRTGTPIHEAKKLCPQLELVKSRHDVYIEYHHKIIKEISQHIQVNHILSIDECACELTGNWSNENVAITIAKKIKQGIKKNVGEYITCSIGIAPNRFLAKIATNMHKPDGLVVIRPNDIPQKIYEVSFSNIPGVGKKTQSRLAKYNITNTKDLYSYDAKYLRKAFGNITGERFWYLLRGIELPSPKTEKLSISHSKVLAPGLRNKNIAGVIIHQLLMQAASRLRTEKLHATRLDIELITAQGEVIKHNSRFQKVNDSLTLNEKLSNLWENTTYKYKFNELKKIGIKLSGFEDRGIQGSLFNEHNDEVIKAQNRRERLSSALDSLNRKYGKNTITIGISYEFLKPSIS